MNKITVFSIFDSEKKFSISLMCDYDVENAKKTFMKNFENAFSRIIELKSEDLIRVVNSMSKTQLLKIGYFDPIANQLEALDDKEIIFDFSDDSISDFVIRFENNLSKDIFNKVYEVIKNV